MHDMPWTKFHWMVIFGLGTAWILDGLEVQIVAAGGFEKSLAMSTADVGLAGIGLPPRPGRRARCSSDGSPTPSVARSSSP